MRLIPFLLLPVFLFARDEKHPLPESERQEMQKQFKEDISDYTEHLSKSPKEVRLYSRRGDMHLFAGNFAKAVADFEKMIELDPSQDAPHWRLGIAYYYINDFKKGMDQFSKYHAYDAVDRENGVWKYFCQSCLEGIKKAEREMLPYTRFDRHPFPAIYDLLGGKEDMSPEKILKAAEVSKESESAKIRRFFFAHLYIGMWYEIQGNKEKAIKHLRLATANAYGRTSKTYMWQVARLQYEQLAGGTFRTAKQP
ncbi:MAG: tetratricopeptide repeat protein [Opitutae bacterium]|jgi:lipoprotein NlpI|nr:tetratricopeptide repeat protein [Opitutae bacterium]MBT5378521.1 tetratricopeptide repeat protein [Opitutae bacterium]MBT5689926.1 tetratricopeptide repeat protein [Opitutae bacterium]MBT6461576.1 tetratricopeptide repeat protein [Opitutae bacterium]MBT6958114.1 tetratricopeptide repeat protein [Opitutae bacterium]